MSLLHYDIETERIKIQPELQTVQEVNRTVYHALVEDEMLHNPDNYDECNKNALIKFIKYYM